MDGQSYIHATANNDLNYSKVESRRMSKTNGKCNVSLKHSSTLMRTTNAVATYTCEAWRKIM